MWRPDDAAVILPRAECLGEDLRPIQWRVEEEHSLALTFDRYLARLTEPNTTLAASELRLLSALETVKARALAAVWPNIPVARRLALVQMMAELADDNVDLDFNPVFKLASSDDDAEVRTAAVQALWEDEEVATADLLVAILSGDPVPRVRAAAALTLGHFVYREELDDLDDCTAGKVKNALYAAFENQAEPLEVRRRALESLSYLSEDRTCNAIAAAYADAAMKLRVSAVFAMGRSCDRQWLPTVLAELQNPIAEFRFEAARASGQLEDQRAVPMLIKLVGDPDREVRAAAIGALGDIGGDQAKRALRHLIQSGDEALAGVAESALDELEINEDPLRMPLSEQSQN